MSMLRQNVLEASTVISAAVQGAQHDLVDNKTCAIQAQWSTLASNPESWSSQAKASHAVGSDLTFTAAAFGTAGNAITVAFTAGATAGAEVVSVVGSAISIQIQSGTSTATQVRTAFNAFAAATALAACAITGTGSNTQTTHTATALTGGVDSVTNLTTNKITMTAHGLVTDEVGQLTTTGGLPAGLSTSTNYFVVRYDANTVGFATSRANAEAGTLVDITNEGTGVQTFTPLTTVSASVAMEGSNDQTTWDVIDSSKTQTISATGQYMWKETGCGYRFTRLNWSYTSGQVTANSTACSK